MTTVRQIGPFCFKCGADTKGEPATYILAPKQGGPFYSCHRCSPPVNFLGISDARG